MTDVSFLTFMSFDDVVHLVHDYQYLIAAISPFLFGEAVIHLFGILIGSGDLPWSLLLITVCAIVFYETAVYAIVRLLVRRCALRERIERVPVLSHIDAVFKTYQARYRRNPYVLLFVIKTVPLTKFTVIFYALRYEMPVLVFMLRDIGLTALWVLVMFTPGFLVGKEFLTEEAGRNLSEFILLFFLVIVLMMIIGKYLERAASKTARVVSRLFGSEH